MRSSNDAARSEAPGLSLSPAKEFHRRCIKAVPRNRRRKRLIGGDQDTPLRQSRCEIKALVNGLIKLERDRLGSGNEAAAGNSSTGAAWIAANAAPASARVMTPRLAFAHSMLLHSMINSSGDASGSSSSNAPAASDPSSSITHLSATLASTTVTPYPGHGRGADRRGSKGLRGGRSSGESQRAVAPPTHGRDQPLWLTRDGPALPSRYHSQRHGVATPQ